MTEHGNTEHYDLVVIGGGINGCGIAADAAGRGLRVLLCEQADLASATSSNSSKLIHGGLRYLEHYEFRLVREALAEREVLLAIAPHIIWPLRFRLPHQRHLRPAWLIRLGLFLYDHLARRRTLQGSHGVRFGADDPLKQQIKRGFEYADAWVDDARLVVLNALAAQQHGATVLTRTRCEQVQTAGSHWQLTLSQPHGVLQVSAAAVVNAAGPWVASLFSKLPCSSPQKIRLVQGSHIVVPRLYSGEQAYILQNQDKRIVFVIPFEDDFSLIGTTDLDYQGEPQRCVITQAETDYLLAVSNSYFKKQISAADIRHSFAGVRPLLDDDSSAAQQVTRDYKLELQTPAGLPLLSVFGGKITTYRKLAQAAVDTLKPYFKAAGPCISDSKPLPGGDFTDQHSLWQQLCLHYPFVDQAVLKRFVRSYGTLSYTLLAGVTEPAQLGRHFGHGLYQREVDYLCSEEFAQSAEDILWRRSKLGLRLSATEQAAVADYLTQRTVAA